MAEQVLKVISGCYYTNFMVLRYIVNFSRRSLILWVLERILVSISYLFVKKCRLYETFAIKVASSIQKYYRSLKMWAHKTK